ncbi:DUF4123 domain-containing protein [Burkholderia sp. Ac-20379]|uniref:DUF4123 domain-containing protein n=1 Tax=Burkholderia sp. Ac-20379 TaxID=2703900 RepID=UPI001980D75C|nr:DUF4123 domain-containing protein [Burkholderia sp. Ac-20379]MBN3725184.1 DUF4123 domain-containing protein [Burkholderia sp. Ac-20379]
MEESSAIGQGQDWHDEAVASVLARLHAYFGKRPQMQCYLVVDPGHRDIANDEAVSQMLEALPRERVQVEHDAFPASQQPYLAALDLDRAADAALLEASVRIAVADRHPMSMAQGLGQRVGGWLASEAPLSDVAGHLSRLVLQYNEEGRPCVLRFYDSRALSLIWPVLSESQQQTLLGPISAWHALDACAQPDAYLGDAGARRDLALDGTQWRQIHRHGLINRALALHAMTAGRQPEPPEIEAALAAAEQAEHHGLSDRDDHVAFIGHALTWHARFYRYPKVLQLLSAMKPGDFYTGAIAALTDADLADIRGGAWYSRSGAASPH